MRTFDFTPFYRSTVGFDHLFDLLDSGGRRTAGLPTTSRKLPRTSTASPWPWPASLAAKSN